MDALTFRSVTAIVPTLNEAQAIGGVVRGLLERGISRVVVSDGASSDGTAGVASDAGATVIVDPRRGYGNACLAGVAAAGNAPVLLFLDGDGAEDLDGAVRVVREVLEDRADLALGTRGAQGVESGAQTSLARFGNRACSLWLRLAFGATITDLPSMKAVRRSTYDHLHVDHRQFGWTAQFLARAARARVRIVEIPVRYHRRTGSSKVSGTVRGALVAGGQMLAVIGREHLTASWEQIHESKQFPAARKTYGRG
jgi:glycosyltransferase involved in cell wall biosynthesis